MRSKLGFISDLGLHFPESLPQFLHLKKEVTQTKELDYSIQGRRAASRAVPGAGSRRSFLSQGP